jgi:hypothetical protein
MGAKQSGIDPPNSEKEKTTLQGGSLNAARDLNNMLAVSAEAVNAEADCFLLQWLRTGADYYRRLARATADAARKGSP